MLSVIMLNVVAPINTIIKMATKSFRNRGCNLYLFNFTPFKNSVRSSDDVITWTKVRIPKPVSLTISKSSYIKYDSLLLLRLYYKIFYGGNLRIFIIS